MLQDGAWASPLGHTSPPELKLFGAVMFFFPNCALDEAGCFINGTYRMTRRKRSERMLWEDVVDEFALIHTRPMLDHRSTAEQYF